MRRMRQFVRGSLVALMFLGGCGIVTVVFPLLNGLGIHRVTTWVGRIQQAWFGVLLHILRVRVTRIGQVMESPGLLVANHISWLDIVILGAQQPLTFVAKSEVGTWPIVGYLAKRIGTVFVRRGDPASSQRAAERMIWRLRQGRHVLLFPEGTSTRGETVLRFHPRLFQPALLAQAPVQAVALAYGGAAERLAPFVGEDAFLPHLLKLLALPAIETRIIYTTPVASSKYDRDALARHTRAEITAALRSTRASACHVA